MSTSTLIDPAKVEVNLGPDVYITENETTVLDAGSGFSSYLWSTSETASTINVSGPVLGEGSYVYWVQVSDDNNCEASDTIKVTISPAVGIADCNVSSKVKIYPNPAGNYFYIDVPEESYAALSAEILDIEGKTIKTISNIRKGNPFRISMLDLVTGVYFVKVKAPNEVYLLRMLVKR